MYVTIGLPITIAVPHGCKETHCVVITNTCVCVTLATGHCLAALPHAVTAQSPHTDVFLP